MNEPFEASEAVVLPVAIHTSTDSSWSSLQIVRPPIYTSLQYQSPKQDISSPQTINFTSASTSSVSSLILHEPRSPSFAGLSLQHITQAPFEIPKTTKPRAMSTMSPSGRCCLPSSSSLAFLGIFSSPPAKCVAHGCKELPSPQTSPKTRNGPFHSDVPGLTTDYSKTLTLSPVFKGCNVCFLVRLEPFHSVHGHQPIP